MNHNNKVQRILRRMGQMEQERANWERHWRDLSEHFLPRRSRFLTERGAWQNPNTDKRNTKLVDSTGLLAVRTLSSGMQSGLTSPARPWFRLSLQQEDHAQSAEAKAWLHATQEAMNGVFAQSNLYDQIHTLYHELTVFGTACMIVEEDPVKILRCRTLSIGEYYLDHDAAGRVNSLYRKLSLNAAQIAEQWPLGTPERIRLLAESDSPQKFDILHVIEPNQEHQPNSDYAGHRPFISLYILAGGENEILDENGYYEFPALCPRWNIQSGEVYGYSPAMDALADCRMLQRMRRDGLEALAREVRPPLNIPGGLGAGGVLPDISPGALNFISPLSQGQEAITPLYRVNSNLQALEGTVASYQQQIKEIFFYDLFLMLSEAPRQMTATEVSERNGEKMLILGPVLDRLRSELFQPLIERSFKIMQRGTYLPPLPPSLLGHELKIEFVSILAQAQKSAGVGAVQQVVNFVGQSSTLNPEVLDKLDLDEAVDQVAEMSGVPPLLIRSDEAVQAIRTERAGREAKARQLAGLEKGLDMAGRAAETMKNINAGAQNVEHL